MWALIILSKKNADRYRLDNLKNDDNNWTGATTIFLFVHVEKQGNDLFVTDY